MEKSRRIGEDGTIKSKRQGVVKIGLYFISCEAVQVLSKVVYNMRLLLTNLTISSFMYRIFSSL
jgi:hypothetical protein